MPRKPEYLPATMRGSPEAMDRVRAAVSGFTGLGERPSVMTRGASDLYDSAELAGLLSGGVGGLGMIRAPIRQAAAIARSPRGVQRLLAGHAPDAITATPATLRQVSNLSDDFFRQAEDLGAAQREHYRRLQQKFPVNTPHPADIQSIFLDAPVDKRLAFEVTSPARGWAVVDPESGYIAGVASEKAGGDIFAPTVNALLEQFPGTKFHATAASDALAKLYRSKGIPVDDLKMNFADGGSVKPQHPRMTNPRLNGGLSRAAEALRRVEQERQAQRSVFNQPREAAWQPDYERPGGHALEAPMISPDDLIGTGIPTKIAMTLKGAAPMLAGLGVIKNKGGNWLNGSVEGVLGGLMKPEAGIHGGVGSRITRETAEELGIANMPDYRARVSLNNWIDKQLTRYVKNDMATPQDPIRALAERGVLHYEPAANLTHPAENMRRVAREYGGNVASVQGKTPLSRAWEDVADNSIGTVPASIRMNYPGQPESSPWMAKLANPATTLVHHANRNPEGLGFNHLIDELSNAINPESGLPRHLLLDPKSLDRVSVPQAVERVAQINAWRAAQKAEADALKANNAATVLHKEYPEKGMKWVELRTPEDAKNEVVRKGNDWFAVDESGKFVSGTPHSSAESAALEPVSSKALKDALKYEGDTMGHCVGGYCDDVASGRTKIYSLRDAKGQPHVTVEVAPTGGRDYESMRNFPEGPRIVQIKGKQNRAPNEEYLPFVQDFVKSGKWSDVGDLENAGLQRAGWAPDVLERMKAHGIEAPEYGTADEINAALNALNKAKGFARGGPVTPNKILTSSQLEAIIQQLRMEQSNA